MNMIILGFVVLLRKNINIFLSKLLIQLPTAAEVSGLRESEKMGGGGGGGVTKCQQGEGFSALLLLISLPE